MLNGYILKRSPDNNNGFKKAGDKNCVKIQNIEFYSGVTTIVFASPALRDEAIP
jgi:hypothetical protein